MAAVDVLHNALTNKRAVPIRLVHIRLARYAIMCQPFEKCVNRW